MAQATCLLGGWLLPFAFFELAVNFRFFPPKPALMQQPLPPFSLSGSPNVPELLTQLRCTLAVSTCQAGKVIFIRARDEKNLMQLRWATSATTARQTRSMTYKSCQA